jgi:predicted DNA-binding protein (MmcQ/YjbR family)
MSTRIEDRLRKICLTLPRTDETVTFSHPTFRVAGKTFCVLDVYKGETAIAVKVGKAAQGIFLEDPRFYRTPYIGQHGWISLRVQGRLNWEEVEELVKGSYGLMSPR